MFVNVLPEKNNFIHSVAPLFAPTAFNVFFIVNKRSVSHSFVEWHTTPPNTCSFQSGRTACLRKIYFCIRTRSQPKQTFGPDNSAYIFFVQIFPKPFGVKRLLVAEYKCTNAVFFRFRRMVF